VTNGPASGFRFGHRCDRHFSFEGSHAGRVPPDRDRAGHYPRTVSLTCTVDVRSVMFSRCPWEGVISGRVTDQDVEGCRAPLHRVAAAPVYRCGNKRFVTRRRTAANGDGPVSPLDKPSRGDVLSCGGHFRTARKIRAIRSTSPRFIRARIDSYAAAPIVVRGPAKLQCTDIPPA